MTTRRPPAKCVHRTDDQQTFEFVAATPESFPEHVDPTGFQPDPAPTAWTGPAARNYSQKKAETLRTSIPSVPLHTAINVPADRRMQDQSGSTSSTAAATPTLSTNAWQDVLLILRGVREAVTGQRDRAPKS